MKKILSLFLVVIALVTCFACKKNDQVKLCPPDDYFCNHFQTFFEDDTYVYVEPYSADDVLRVHVTDEDTYCALFKCFNGGDWKYGSKKVKIDFIYEGGAQPNVQLGTMYDSDIEALFRGNKYFVRTQKDKGGFQFYHVLFKPECICTYIDNIASPYGIDCKSVEDVANIVFKNCKLGVVFNSERK